ncbi:acetyltransferase [Candidatus Pelagibacter sp.]|nr:acetyltransferase [Candidatus Pelagibacter sp.]
MVKKNKKKILIIGNGQHAKVVGSMIIDDNNYKVIGVLGSGIKNTYKKNSIFFNYKNKKIKYLGNIRNLKKIKFNEIIIAIGDNYIREMLYKKIIKLYKKTKINFAKVISKNSKVSNNVKIGPGTVVLGGSIINFNTVIGSNCLINNSVSINHDNIIKDFASLGPGVITGGNVKLGFNSHIGIGTVLKNNISIDENTIVGGGSYVNKNCKKNFIYYGVPATPIRKRKKSEKYY